MIDLDELHNKMISYVLVGFTNSDISPIDAIELLMRLSQAEKDAARYKDKIEAAGFDIGNLSSKLERADSVIFEVERVLSERHKNGSFDCDDLLSEAQYYIDNHQGIKE